MKKLLILTLFSTLTLMGCSKPDSVGKVDGKPVTKQSFEAYLQLKNIPVTDKERTQRALEIYLERAAMSAAIQKTDVLNASLVQAELDEFKNQMLLSRYFESYLKQAASDDAIRNYYSNHIDRFQSKKVQVAHILLRVKSTMAESERQAILTTAHEAYSKLQSGESFDAIAKTYSEDKISAVKGGDLGWINEGAVTPEFSDKAFSMAPGSFSEPFLTSFGFHILKVTEAPQVIKKPLEAVKGDIRYQLRNEARQAEKERLLKTIKYSKDS